MRKILVALLVIVSFWAAGSGQAAASFVETFDTNNANWNYGYGVNFPVVNPATWVARGGNPGGYNTGASQNLYAVWTYDTAPYGNMNGLNLTIDTRVTAGEQGTAQFYVGKGGDFYVDGTWAIGGDGNWTTHTVALNATNFVPWTGGPNNNIYTLAQVLSAPDDIGIFFGGNIVSGTGNFDVDNYGTVNPTQIPTTSLLFGSGLLGLIGIRRRLS